MTMEWGNDLILQFIDAYKSEPGVWCSSHRHYKDRRHLKDAWDRIAKRMNIEVADLKRKKESIMASYRGLAKKKQFSLKTGDIYHPIWFAYEALEQFLNPELAQYRPVRADNRSKTRELEEPTFQEESDREEYLIEDNEIEENEVEEVTYNTNTSKLLIKQEPKQIQRSKLINSHQPKPRLTIRRPIKKRIIKTNDSAISELRLLETLKSHKRSDYLKRKRDECDTFGDYIAESLRKHDDRTQSMIKQAINNILFEQEMKKYNSEQYVVITEELTEEENPLILGDQDKQLNKH